jgi:glycosyltransferase involved in cell wall biosynthesis
VPELDGARIAMLSPISWRTPPRHYGPWEQVVSNLTEGLVERGLDVTLYATGDSLTGAKLRSVCPRPYSEDPELPPKVWECLHIAALFEQAKEFDLIHNHFDFLPLSYSGLVDTPLLTTIHGFSSEGILPVYEKYNSRSHYVAISNADRAATLDYIATIHHGIEVEQFSFCDRPDDYLLFFGRIHPDKGAAEAIKVAQECGRPLLIAGIIQDSSYFEKEVAPHVDGRRINYVGPAGPQKRNELLGQACAMLHLINFNEPFGLSVIESMACGTPVIACDRGSMPELIRHGETGFLVKTLDEAVKSVEMIHAIDRGRCREHVVRNFSLGQMIERYLDVYERILSGEKAVLPLPK